MAVQERLAHDSEYETSHTFFYFNKSSDLQMPVEMTIVSIVVALDFQI